MRLFSTYGAFNPEIQQLIQILESQENFSKKELKDFFYGNIATPFHLTTMAIFHGSQMGQFEKYVGDEFSATGKYPENITEQMMINYKHSGFAAIRDKFSQAFGGKDSALKIFDEYTKKSVINAAEFCELQGRIYSELHKEMNKNLEKTWGKEEKTKFFFEKLTAEMVAIKNTKPSLAGKIDSHMQLMGEFIKRLAQLSQPVSQAAISPRLRLYPASHETAVSTQEAMGARNNSSAPTR